MGPSAPSQTTSGGRGFVNGFGLSGRWSAVNSLWTYFLRLLGISTIDQEELLLLSAPLVRVRSAFPPFRVLAHVADQTAPTEPLGLVEPGTATREQTLFLLHFVNDGAVSSPNRARIATAFPTDTSPRAWVAVNPKTGYLSLTFAEVNASVFEIRHSKNSSGRRGSDVSFVFQSVQGSFLSSSGPGTSRVRVCGKRQGKRELFCVNAVATSPVAQVSACVPFSTEENFQSSPSSSHASVDLSGGGAGVVDGELDRDLVNGIDERSAVAVPDATMVARLQQKMLLPVRLHSAAFGWFVASSPGAPLAAASKKEAGWDAFTIEFDLATHSARIRDSRGMYIVIGEDLRSFKASVVVDGESKSRAGELVETKHGDGIEHRVGSRGEVKSPVRSCKSGDCSKVEVVAHPNESSFEESRKCPSRSSKSAAVESCANDDPSTVVVPRRAERFMLTPVGPGDRVSLRCRKGYLSACRNGSVTISQNTCPGLREEFFLRLALPSMMDQSSPSLRLRHYAHGVREVDASIVVPANAELVYSVLRDYNGFEKFIGDCSRSQLVRRNEDGSLVVRMSQAHSFLVLTISMTMSLRVLENDAERKVSMSLIEGLGVKTYKGTWHVAERSDGRSNLGVKISSSPAVPAPNFLVDGVMSHAVSSTLEEIKKECIVRSTDSNHGNV